MILAVAATEIEMVPLQALLQQENIRCLTCISGVGPMETAVRLTGFLAARSKEITAVVNVGVAGGYIVDSGEDGPQLLDLYLAETETFGDLGICFPDRIEPLPESLTGNMEGAAVARVCAEFSLPLLELRCISNLVEDRNPAHWRLQEACEKAARTAAVLIKNMKTLP